MCTDPETHVKCVCPQQTPEASTHTSWQDHSLRAGLGLCALPALTGVLSLTPCSACATLASACVRARHADTSPALLPSASVSSCVCAHTNRASMHITSNNEEKGVGVPPTNLPAECVCVCVCVCCLRVFCVRDYVRLCAPVCVLVCVNHICRPVPCTQCVHLRVSLTLSPL